MDLEIMNKYVDKKVTIWIRQHLRDDADMVKVVREVESNMLYVLPDIERYLDEVLYETEEPVLDAEGIEVVQVYDNDTMIWSNEQIPTEEE
jgi:hypothetical protein